jgi:hypothetical protein
MSPRTISIACLTIALAGCADNPASPPSTPPATRSVATKPTMTKPVAANQNTISLFDGKTMTNWKVTEFGGEGPADVEDGTLVVRAGSTLSGVTWTGPKLPTMNYQVDLDAKKLDGSDFFVGLTFPYGDSHASLILGGWGGSVTGISSVNGEDAANNETSSAQDFKKGKWYHVTLKVMKNHITAYVDNDTQNPTVDLDTENKKLDTRIDIDAAKPFGLSTYQTSAAYKNIVIKKL